jgi:C4-dicarboxylate-specific signal transduction histidine kinase
MNTLDSKEIIILVLLGIILILLIWILVIRNKYKRDFENLNRRLHSETDKEIQERTTTLLRLITIPMQWALRAELMNGNTNQAEQYINQYVKEPGIDYLAFVDLSGTIKIASDKKTEGKPYSSFYQEDITGNDTIRIINREHDEKLIIAPVSGLIEKLGTLVMLYHPKSV